MEEIGPVEYMIVSFPGNRFTGEIAPALGKLVESNTIRIIDLAFVGKDEDGSVAAFELSDIDEEVRRGLDALGLEATGLARRGGPAGRRGGPRAGLVGSDAPLGGHLGSRARERPPRAQAASSSPSVGSHTMSSWTRARRCCPPPPTPHRRVDMLRRRGGLVRAAATTAVVAGTAGAVRHRQDQKYAAQDQEAYDQQMAAQQAAAAQAAPAAAGLRRRARTARAAEGRRGSSPRRSSRRRRSRSSGSEFATDQPERRTSARSRLSVPRRPLDDVHLLPVRHLDLDPHHGVRGHLPPEGRRRRDEDAWIIFVIFLPYLGVFDLPDRQSRRDGGQEHRSRRRNSRKRPTPTSSPSRVVPPQRSRRPRASSTPVRSRRPSSTPSRRRRWPPASAPSERRGATGASPLVAPFATAR